MRVTTCSSLMRVAALAGSIGLAAAPALAETDLGPATASGEVEVGGRAITGDNWGDSRFQNYESTRPGVFGRAEGVVEDDDGRYFLEFQARDIAEDDQSYRIGAGGYNRFRIELEYEEFDQVYGGGRALTLHSEQGKGVLVFNGDRAAIQAAAAGAPRAAVLQAAYASAFPADLRAQLKNARAGFFYRVTPDLELNVGYRFMQKEGTRPWGMGFGSPGGTFVNVAAPVDQLTQEVSLGLGYTRETVSLRFEYVGSFFNNDIDTLVVDNPLKAPPDTTAASSQGRDDLPPDNSAHTFTLTGTSKLPAPFPLQATGTLSYGMRLQDDEFIPHTINSALAANPLLILPADSLDGQVNTYLAMLKLAGQPAPRLNAAVFYRFFDYDSDIDRLAFPGHVVNDQGSVVAETRFSNPIDYYKQNAGVDFTYTVSRPLSTRFGFEWERWNRSDHREVEVTDEYIPRVGVTVRPARWVKVRADARAGFRIGQGYNTFAHLAHTVEEGELTPSAFAQAQSVLLRKYDEANRRLYRGDLGVELTPAGPVSVGLMGGYWYADYYDSPLGVRDSWAWNAGTDVSYQPVDWMTLSAFYSFDFQRYDQRSRWRPRTFVAPIVVTDDPINNWESTSSDYVHTVGTTADFVIVANTLDLSTSYILERARTKTRASSTPGTSPAPPDGGNAWDWPTEGDWYHRLVAALRYHVITNLTVKAEYQLALYNLTSFRWDGLDPIEPGASINGSGTGAGTSNDVFLPYLDQDYSAHAFALSLIYRF